MKQIASALVKAQKNFAPALKTNTNPHFRSKYADLSACVEAVIDALNAEGIALMQVPHESETGVVIETMFVHESGEQISGGKVYVPASKNDAQGYGSAMTYARRYGLMAACGIAPEDDDGNAASRNTSKQQEPSPASGAVVKKEAYDSLAAEDRAWVDGLAAEVTQLFNESKDAVELTNYIKEALGPNPPHEFKLAVWHKLDSKVRTKIDSHEKGIRRAA